MGELGPNQRIVNIDTEAMEEVIGKWVEVEGFKIVEAADGSLDIFFTRDIELARYVDEQNAVWASEGKDDG